MADPAILDRLGGIGIPAGGTAADAVQVIDGDLQPGDTEPAGRPCLIVYGGTATPQHRMVDGTASAATEGWSVLCSSNNPDGARWLAGQVVGLLDGWRGPTGMWRVQSVSDPIEDITDPSEYRWSATVTATTPSIPYRSRTS